MMIIFFVFVVHSQLVEPFIITTLVVFPTQLGSFQKPIFSHSQIVFSFGGRKYIPAAELVHMRPIPERPFGARASWSRLYGSFGNTLFLGFYTLHPNWGHDSSVMKVYFNYIVWLKR